MTLLSTQPPPQSPPKPRLPRELRERLHPGWVMLGMSALGVFISAPGQSYSVAAFIDPMLADLQMQRTEYSVAYLVATLLGGLTLPWVGRQVDRFGARLMLPLVALLLGFACFWMSGVHGLLALYVGFSLIRCLGQGSLTLISSWIIGEWFEHRRGLATALMGLGGSLSIMCFPGLNNLLIEQFGWRAAWGILAVVVWIALIVPGLLFLRNRPEEMGLLPDCRRPGDAPLGPEAESALFHKPRIRPTTDSWTVEEARKTATFWKLSAVIAVCSMIGTGLVFHQASLLEAREVARADALLLLGLQAMVATGVSLVAGYLTDRVEARYLLAVSMLFMGAALTLLIFLPTPKLAFVYSAMLGVQGGIIRSTGTVVWINYYGRLHQGAVRGFAFSLMVIAAAFGPLPLALSRDYLGSYQPALVAFLVLPLIAGIGVLTAKQPLKTNA